MFLEYRRYYTFSYKRSSSSSGPRCFSNSACTSRYAKFYEEPANCPVGYRQTGYTISCADVSDPVGVAFRAQCTDWAKCALRAYSTFRGCTSLKYIGFKVRQCSQGRIVTLYVVKRK